MTSLHDMARSLRWPPKILLALALGLVLVQAFGLAQPALPSAAQEALAKGQQTASQALATYDSHFLDRPLWRQAVEYGLAAQRAAPDRPEPYRFLGQVYATVKFYSRAWEAWQTYLELGGQLNAQTNRYVADVASWLGMNSFDQQRYQEAIPYFELLLRVDPESEEANQHLALIHLALGEPEAAKAYLDTLTARYPDNASYRELMAQAEEQLRYGVAASNAYRQGLERYRAGNLADALVAFRQATEANDEFRDAFVWAGRTSLELKRPQEALPYWQRAVALGPGDREAQQALTLARNQASFGIEAYAAYQRGVSQYAQGQLEAAQQSFQEATASNGRYGDAWGWLGRIALETGDLETAAAAYDRARQLTPENATYEAQYQAAAAQLDERRAAQRAQAQAQAEAAAQAERERQAREAEAQRQAEEQAAAAEQARQAEAAQQVAAAEPPAEQPVEPPTEQPEPEGAEAMPPAAPEANAAPAPERAAEAIQPTVQAAPQITLLEVEHTHRVGSSSSGGAYTFFPVPEALTGDLEAPVDYAGGTVFQRLEVMSKPSDAAVRYQLCLVPNDEIVVRPACSSDTLSFDAPGVYEARQALSAFSEYDNIDWGKGLVNVMLVLKDSDGRPLDNTYFLGDAEPIDLGRYYPMQVRYEAVIVPPGGTFQGW